jgi:hypothetical protein
MELPCLAEAEEGVQSSAAAASMDNKPSKRVDLLNQMPVRPGTSLDQGVEVRLPNGQNIPDSKSPTGSVMSPVADWSAVAIAGRQLGAMYQSMPNNPDGAQDAISYLGVSLGAALGHGGTFDYQRSGNHVTGFTQLPQFRNVSNVNVGLLAQQAGLTLDEALTIAGKFAGVQSSNAKPGQPYGLDPQTTQFITTGFDIEKSGVFGRPATP